MCRYVKRLEYTCQLYARHSVTMDRGEARLTPVFLNSWPVAHRTREADDAPFCAAVISRLPRGHDTNGPKPHAPMHLRLAHRQRHSRPSPSSVDVHQEG